MCHHMIGQVLHHHLPPGHHVAPFDFSTNLPIVSWHAATWQLPIGPPRIVISPHHLLVGHPATLLPHGILRLAKTTIFHIINYLSPLPHGYIALPHIPYLPCIFNFCRCTSSRICHVSQSSEVLPESAMSSLSVTCHHGASPLLLTSVHLWIMRKCEPFDLAMCHDLECQFWSYHVIAPQFLCRMLPCDLSSWLPLVLTWFFT